ncbi:PP2C family protein-serine/threonine phosphatase [Streptomyces hirsutus]|uniref:PP2C family protein-serine/threonine phosphatase n=1 Tax=Streptomyces hirsutus TaxID=35620 RepID=UPI0036B56CC6
MRSSGQIPFRARSTSTACPVHARGASGPDTGRAFAIRIGHAPPLLRHPAGRTETLDLVGGVMPGVEADALPPVTALTPEPGSVLALYTDGLVEQPGSDIETRIGIGTVRRTLAHSGTDSVEELADRLVPGPDGPQDKGPARRRGTAAHGVPPGDRGPTFPAPESSLPVPSPVFSCSPAHRLRLRERSGRTGVAQHGEARHDTAVHAPYARVRAKPGADRVTVVPEPDLGTTGRLGAG